MSVIYSHNRNLDFGCGVQEVGQFKTYGYSHDEKLEPASLHSGTGYFISSFINEEVCRRAYELINKQFKIVWQSEVKINSNTNNEFFFIVYRKK